MPKTPSLHRTSRSWLLDGPLATFVPTYVARLKPARYADLAMKERALSRLLQPEASVRRYKARDSLMEFLKMLYL